jgi:hypothetical protein
VLTGLPAFWAHASVVTIRLPPPIHLRPSAEDRRTANSAGTSKLEVRADLPGPEAGDEWNSSPRKIVIHNVLYGTLETEGAVSFSKVDFNGLPKYSSTVRGGQDQAGCGYPADGGPFLFEGPVATEPKVRFSRSPRSVPRRLQPQWVGTGHVGASRIWAE